MRHTPIPLQYKRFPAQLASGVASKWLTPAGQVFCRRTSGSTRIKTFFSRRIEDILYWAELMGEPAMAYAHFLKLT